MHVGAGFIYGPWPKGPQALGGLNSENLKLGVKN